MAFKIENHNVEYYGFSDHWGRAHTRFVKKIIENPDLLRVLFRKAENFGQKQIRITRGWIKKIPTSTNRQLWDYYHMYVQMNTEMYSYGLPVSLLDYQKYTFLSDQLAKILKKRNAEAFSSVLTIPDRETYNKRQEVALFLLCGKILRSASLVKKCKEMHAAPLEEYIKKFFPHIYRLLQKHTKKFCWTFYVYDGPAVTITYFIEAIQDFIRRGIDPRTKLAEERRAERQLFKKQRAILTKLRLTSYEKKLVLLARDAVFYKPYRRELQSWSYYHVEFLLREIGRRTGLSLAQVRMMLPSEVRVALVHHKVAVDVLNERLKIVVYGGLRPDYCLSGIAARTFVKKNMQQKRIVVHAKEIHGTTAYAGKVRGVVSIVNSPDQIHKMKENGILVSTTTSPNLMPAIRRAAAIVTDEGGLTCHAAIVSRELNIPCIVGTNYATHILKDGDKVEVDATRGIVRKI